MGNLDKVLGICSVCKSIRISDESKIWLKEEDNPELYNRFIKKYEGKLSHTYCPKHFEEAMKNLDTSNSDPVWPLEMPREYLR